MTLDRAVLLFAGLVNLLGIALAHFVHPAWIWLSVFVSANLMQSAVTGFCPAAILFKRLGVNPGPAFR